MGVTAMVVVITYTVTTTMMIRCSDDVFEYHGRDDKYKDGSNGNARDTTSVDR